MAGGDGGRGPLALAVELAALGGQRKIVGREKTLGREKMPPGSHADARRQKAPGREAAPSSVRAGRSAGAR